MEDELSASRKAYVIMLHQLAIIGIMRAQELHPEEFEKLQGIEMKIRRNLLKLEGTLP